MDKYVKVEMEIIEFEVEDVITTSGLGEGAQKKMIGIDSTHIVKQATGAAQSTDLTVGKEQRAPSLRFYPTFPYMRDPGETSVSQ